MHINHNPRHQLDNVLQCLSSNKRPIGFFIGAGCPLSIKKENNEPIIPDVAGLTNVIGSNLSSPEKDDFKVLTENLLSDGIKTPTIEDYLSHIRALSIVAGSTEVRGLTKEKLIRIERKICDEIESIVNQKHINTDSPYHYFSNWIGSVKRENPIEIFTTNYDLLLEHALESMQIPFFDGFLGSENAFFDLQAIESDQLPARWARLWKLHGSINWFRDTNGRISRSTSQDSQNKDYMIHPSHLKYDQSRKMPFLVMIDCLRSFLKKTTSTLFISGYSFGDEHLNEVLLQGLKSNPTASIFALQYPTLEESNSAVELAKRQPNLTILAKDGAVIGGKSGLWELVEDIKSICIEESNALTTEDNSSQSMSFNLGNYSVFGEFLKTISGHNLNIRYVNE